MRLRLRLIFFREYFLILLPVFFVFHGYNDNYGLVPFTDVVELSFLYILSILFFATLIFLFFRSWAKASLFIFFLSCFYFFFGALHDTLKSYAPGVFVTKYVFILPFLLMLLSFLAVFLKRTHRKFYRFSRYLNLALSLLLFLEIIRFGAKAKGVNYIGAQPLPTLEAICDTCSQPDVYFIVADEYPGQEALTDIFSFDNAVFENDLKQRGFQIVSKSRSNYNWTPYSLASLLSMNYLQLRTKEVIIPGMLACEDEIKKSPLIQFFSKAGYTIYNHSIFTINNKPSPLLPIFVSSRRFLLTSSTLIDRLRKDLGFHLKTESELEQVKKKYLLNNLKADSLTKKIAATKVAERKFVYTHLMLPHHPYFFDSTGKAVPPEVLEDDYKLNKPAFISYLIYSNKQLLTLIDYILAASTQEPIIVLMSDHGFRQFTDNTKDDYHFVNLNAVLLPGRKSAVFYKGMSNVNSFRLLLNTEFGQHLPLLKDSSIFLWEK